MPPIVADDISPVTDPGEELPCGALSAASDTWQARMTLEEEVNPRACALEMVNGAPLLILRIMR